MIAKGGKILVKSLGPVAETALAKAAKKFVRNEFGGIRAGFGDAAAKAAKNIGINPTDIIIDNGVATIKIRRSRFFRATDIASLKNALKTQGASNIVINSGEVINLRLQNILGYLADSGKKYNGLNVFRTGNPVNEFILTGTF